MQRVIEDDAPVVKVDVIVGFPRAYRAGVVPDATFLDAPQHSLVVECHEGSIAGAGHGVQVRRIVTRVEASPVLFARPGNVRDPQPYADEGGVFSRAPETSDLSRPIAPDERVHPAARHQESLACDAKFVDVTEALARDAPAASQPLVEGVDRVECANVDSPAADDDPARAALSPAAGWTVAGGQVD
jgi:hypothetical protein